jgi:hypothetical protein
LRHGWVGNSGGTSKGQRQLLPPNVWRSFIEFRSRKLLDEPLTQYTNAAIVERRNARVVPEASGSPPAQAP